MKKITLSLLTVVFAAVVTTSSNAQSLQASAGSENAIFTAEGNSSAFKSAEKFNKAGLRAMKAFKESNATAQNVRWNVENDVIYATSNSPEKTTTTVYDKKGRWMHTITNCLESQMPSNVRSLVKRSMYFDYQINGVQEISIEEGTFYIVHLEGEKDFRQVCVTIDGELKEIKSFKKQ